MLIRHLLLAVVLLTVPASALAASQCCRADELCCAGEEPACPVGAAGECTNIAASQTVATPIPVGHPLDGPLPAPGIEPRPASRPAAILAARACGADPAPSQRFLPLRN